MSDPARAVAAHPLDSQAARCRIGHHLALGNAGRQMQHHVQSRGQPADGKLGCGTGKGTDQPVSAAAVDQPRTADVPVVPAGGDQVGEDQLSRLLPRRSDTDLAETRSSSSRGGTTSQPSRTAGASVLLAVPA